MKLKKNKYEIHSLLNLIGPVYSEALLIQTKNVIPQPSRVEITNKDCIASIMLLKLWG